MNNIKVIKRINKLIERTKQLKIIKKYDFRNISTNELYELINDNTTDERIEEILKGAGIYE